MEGFSRDLLGGIGKGDAPPPEERPGQLREEMEEVELSLGLSLGGRFGVDRKGDNLPRSSSVAAVLTPPVEVPAPPALPRTSSLPVQAEAPEVPASGIPFAAPSGGAEHKMQGTTVIEEPSSSSSVPFSGEAVSSVMAARPPPPLSSAPRTAALGSSGHQSILGRAAASNNSMGHVERRLMQEMPSVFTKDLPNGKRVEGFLYKYRKAEDVKIVCLCHGSFLTPSEFVEHAGAGKVDNPQRHIVVSPTPTL